MASPKIQVEFAPGGGTLSVRVSFKGLISAAYSLTLWPAQGSTPVVRRKGNNENESAFDCDLPTPAGDNAGRIIELRTEFTGLDPETAKSYVISASVRQGGVQVGSAVEDAGEVTGQLQSSQIYIELLST